MAKHSMIVLEKAVVREPGYLYFVDKHGNVCKSPLRSKLKELGLQ